MGHFYFREAREKPTGKSTSTGSLEMSPQRTYAHHYTAVGPSIRMTIPFQDHTHNHQPKEMAVLPARPLHREKVEPVLALVAWFCPEKQQAG
jgi:hypothetical protein